MTYLLVAIGVIVVVAVAVALVVRRRNRSQVDASGDPLTRARQSGSTLSSDWRRGKRNRRLRKRKGVSGWATGSVGIDTSGGCSGGGDGGGGGCGGGGGGE